MRSIALAIALVSSASAINLYTCAQNTACNIAVGGSCNSSGPLFANSGSASCDYSVSFCKGTTKICTALPSNVGDDCTEAGDCLGSLYCDFSTKKCAASTSSSSGYSYSYSGEGGQCGLVGTSYYLCNTGLECMTTVCKRKPRLGETCGQTINDPSCITGSTCSSLSKKCIGYYIGVGTTNCTSDSHCYLGYFCNSTINACQAKTMTPSLTACNSTFTCAFCSPPTVGCGSQETCACDKYGGTGRCIIDSDMLVPDVLTGCVSEVNSLKACLEDTSQGSCSSPYYTAQCCINTKKRNYNSPFRYNAPAVAFNGGLYKEVCSAPSGCFSGAASVAPVAAAALFAALLALLA